MNLEFASKRLADVEETICRQMYATTITEALEVATKFKLEPYVLSTRPLRDERAFLLDRIAALKRETK